MEEEASNTAQTEEEIPESSIDLLSIFSQGVRLVREEAFKEASACFEKITELEPTNKKAWSWLGYSYFLRKKYRSCYSAYSRSSDMSDAFFRFALGKYSLKFNQSSTAELHFQSVLSDDFEFKDQVFLDLGQLYKDRKDYEKSLCYLQNASLYPRVQVEALKNMGECYQCLGQLQKTISTFTSALELDSSNFKILEMLGWTYFVNKEYETSITVYERALNAKCSTSETADVHYLIARSLIELKNFAEAKNALEKAIRDKENSYVYWWTAGIMYAKALQAHDALDCFINASLLSPDNPCIWGNMGIVYELNGQTAEAKAAYSKALTYEINSPWITSLLEGVSLEREPPEFLHPEIQISEDSFANEIYQEQVLEDLDTVGSYDTDEEEFSTVEIIGFLLQILVLFLANRTNNQETPRKRKPSSSDDQTKKHKKTN